MSEAINPVPEFTNFLATETSPYLLQHAHNPVDWHAWNTETLELARASGKLMLISIGYSACHWCHVMERESFENLEVAALMNQHFTCIKVDREERPDVDQVYLEAIQLMNGQGGWPLNCVALPDGRPIFGGTYFPVEHWKQVLVDLSDFWKTKPEDAHDYAARLTEGIQQMGLFKTPADTKVGTVSELQQIIEAFYRQVDREQGGFGRAPKFPLPNSWLLLLRHQAFMPEKSHADLIFHTLDAMALGGIYDQLGGGFSRYATDRQWLVPHFEKMLYDNAQLLGLYAEAWQASGDPFYKNTAREIVSFVSRDLGQEEGGFFSALDADSEGEEGKFYVWSHSELASMLGSHEPVFSAWYQARPAGNWEGKNILHRKKDIRELASRLGMEPGELDSIIARSRSRLLIERARRIPPALDDKVLTSWNALMVSSLARAAFIFQDTGMQATATRTASFLLSRLVTGSVLHRSYKNGLARIPGFLDDHIFLAEALLSVYECTQDETWAHKSLHWLERSLELFMDDDTGMFWYTQKGSSDLPAQKQEVFDNVIPSSSSVAARLLLRLGILFDKPEFVRRSELMLAAVMDQMMSHPPSFSNWALLMTEHLRGLDQVIISGPGNKETLKKFASIHLPFAMFMCTGSEPDTMPLLKDKAAGKAGETLIYVCRGNSCQPPVSTIEEALVFLMTS